MSIDFSDNFTLTPDIQTHTYALSISYFVKKTLLFLTSTDDKTVKQTNSELQNLALYLDWINWRMENQGEFITMMQQIQSSKIT